MLINMGNVNPNPKLILFPILKTLCKTTLPKCSDFHCYQFPTETFHPSQVFASCLKTYTTFTAWWWWTN